jgi:hypothetical protein
LRKAIAGCVDTAAHGGGTASGRVRLSRGGGRRPLGVPVIPLRPQVPWTRLYQPSAILFVNDPGRDVAVRSDHLRDEFGLTRAEAALALEILARRRAPAAERAGHPLASAGARTSRTSSRRRERAGRPRWCG